MDQTLIIWTIVCFAMAIILFILEIFIPSGGILAVMSAISGIVAIALLFRLNTNLGLIGAIVTIVSTLR